MRKTIFLLAVASLMLIALAGRAWAYSEDDADTLLGLGAGAVLTDGNYHDTFIRADAGAQNTTGHHNTFVGRPLVSLTPQETTIVSLGKRLDTPTPQAFEIVSSGWRLDTLIPLGNAILLS